MEWLNTVFQGLVNTLDITAGFNPRLIFGMFLLALLGEMEIQVPLLMETIWLTAGYQLRASVWPLSNLLATFFLAQLARQITMNVLYYFFGLVHSPLARLFDHLLLNNKYYKKYLAGDSPGSASFFNTASSTVAMLTPLNYPMKILLIARRKQKVLLIATLLSGMAFDLTYVLVGAIFQVTSLNPGYLPVFLLFGLLLFFIFRATILKRKVAG